MFGFAKIRGYSPWPAKVMGEISEKGNFWVQFYGKDEFGSINAKNWTQLTTESYNKLD